MITCDCCGDETDGLFPILSTKANEDYPERTEIYTWCGLCFEIGSCKGPLGGACYRHEYDDVWYEKTMYEDWGWDDEEAS